MHDQNSARTGAPGKVYLVGAGPGAADLLTLKAARLLGQADVVLHDDLVGPEILELAGRARLIAVGKRCGQASAAQVDINRLMIEAAQQHPVVVRLKGGDPAVFGRLDEETAALRAAGIDHEVVPGITAASAAAAAIGLSLTSRGQTRQVTLLTPSCAPEYGEDIVDALALSPSTTAVFYMGGRLSKRIGKLLLERGYSPDTPVAVIKSASLPEQQVHWTSAAMLAVSPPEAGGGPVLIMAGCFSEAADDHRPGDRQPGDRSQYQREHDGGTAQVLGAAGKRMTVD